MKLKTILALLMASATTLSVSNLSAANFNYGYVELGAGDFYSDDIDDSDPTLFIAGSFAINDSFNVVADYATTTLASQNSVDLDVNIYSLGVGYHAPLSNSTDYTAKISYIGTDAELTNGFASQEIADGSGYGVGVGIRHKVSNNFEAFGSVDYADIEDSSDTAVTVGGRYYFNQSISAGLAYTSGDADGVSGAIRFDF